jgi:hypothetical protein
MIRKAFERDGYECKMCPRPAETIAYMLRPQLGGRLERPSPTCCAHNLAGG